jgi:hypothetical protein
MHKIASTSKSTKATASTLAAASLLLLAQVCATAPAFAQACNLAGSPRTTLRTPLIYGAPASQPFEMAPEGQPPPIGDGSVPAPVTYGMGGPPTLIPSIPITPSNHINYPSCDIPYNPATQAPPGVLGPSLNAPPPPSTPGYDPGIIDRPMDFYHPPVSVVPINPGGGISGSAPTQRWGGQTTRDFGRYKYEGKRAFDFGQQAYGQISQDGPCQTLPGAQPTMDCYGRRQPYTNGQTSRQTIAPF